MGSWRAVPHLHPAPGRSIHTWAARRRGGASRPDRWQDAFPDSTSFSRFALYRTPAGFGQMADRAGESADGARYGESHVGAALRRRYSEIAGKLRENWHASYESRTA